MGDAKPIRKAPKPRGAGKQVQAAEGTPGAVLLDLFMRPLGLTAYRVSKDIGAAPITLSQIIHGQRAISPNMALRLGRYFGVAAQFWLTLQSLHDLNAESLDNDILESIGTCAALQGRQFVIREVRQQGAPPGSAQLLVQLASPSRRNNA